MVACSPPTAAPGVLIFRISQAQLLQGLSLLSLAGLGDRQSWLGGGGGCVTWEVSAAQTIFSKYPPCLQSPLALWRLPGVPDPERIQGSGLGTSPLSVSLAFAGCGVCTPGLHRSFCFPISKPLLTVFGVFLAFSSDHFRLIDLNPKTLKCHYCHFCGVWRG